MPLQIIRNDITVMRVDAIVTTADPALEGRGGVNGRIHQAAGPALLAECRRTGGCPPGGAVFTHAGRLPCRYVIHTVGPRWQGGGRGEREQLAACYRAALALAQKKRCKTVAFPLIASGAFGYPRDEALRVAVDTIGAFLLEHEMTVYLVVFDRQSYQISGRLFADIAAYIDDRYVDLHAGRDRRRTVMWSGNTADTAAAPAPAPMASMPAGNRASSLEDALRQLDESFTEMLLRKIGEKGMTDAQCYKKANIDRKLFSKIRRDRLYRPSKPTALAFAIALELPLAETNDLLMKAGFALSRSSKFDVIVEFFIEKGIYDIFAINEALFAFDQSLLGA